MSYFKVGDVVSLNKDIHRLERNPNLDYDEYSFQLYASKGECGVITELFIPDSTGMNGKSPWCAKVKIEDVIKTFRLTSLTQTSKND